MFVFCYIFSLQVSCHHFAKPPTTQTTQPMDKNELVFYIYTHIYVYVYEKRDKENKMGVNEIREL